jgi:hypothetical protein
MTERGTRITVYIPTLTAILLDALMEEHGGNQSRAIRAAIEEAAARRGYIVVPARVEKVEAIDHA